MLHMRWAEHRTRGAVYRGLSRVRASRGALALVDLRYERGLSTQLEVLDAQRQLFSAELELASTTRDQFAAVIQLYKALGGGWQSQPPAGHSPSP